jgi:type I restriction enzyme R subunit
VAFYDALAANESAVVAMGDAKLRVIAAELITQVRKSVTIDWALREGARARDSGDGQTHPEQVWLPAGLAG